MNSNKKEGIEDGISINKNYHVVIPFELLEFLSVDYSYKTKDVFLAYKRSKPHRVLFCI